MPEVNRRWEELGDSKDEKQKLAFIGKCAQEMLKNESPEVRREVAAFRNKDELSRGSDEATEVEELRAKQQ